MLQCNKINIIIVLTIFLQGCYLCDLIGTPYTQCQSYYCFPFFFIQKPLLLTILWQVTQTEVLVIGFDFKILDNIISANNRLTFMFHNVVVNFRIYFNVCLYSQVYFVTRSFLRMYILCELREYVLIIIFLVKKKYKYIFFTKKIIILKKKNIKKNN